MPKKSIRSSCWFGRDAVSHILFYRSKHGRLFKIRVSRSDIPMLRCLRVTVTGTKRRSYARVIHSKHRYTYLHRWLMGLRRYDKLEVDHVNGQTLDNRRMNLRVVTRGQQGQNIVRGTNQTGHRNVFWDPRTAKYRVQVRGWRSGEHKTFSGGRHATLASAVRAAIALRAAVQTHHVEKRCHQRSW